MSEPTPWYFLPDNEIPKGFTYPKSYLDFIDNMQSPNGAMLGMFPWVFSGDWISGKNKSKETFGTELVPFAQAEGIDIVAYFEVSNEPEPKVWICDPWEATVELRIYKVLDNFGAWLAYAKEVSNNELEKTPHFRNDEFWFPKLN